MWQSKETMAPLSTGEPVVSRDHCAAARRSAIGVLPPNRFDRDSWLSANVLTHSTSFSLNVAYTDAERFRHTSKVGGESVTLHTAEAVNPARPAGPSVVMILTAEPRRAMASRKSCFSTGRMSL